MEELLFKIMDLNIYDAIIAFCVVMFLLIWILDRKITHALIFVGVVVVICGCFFVLRDARSIIGEPYYSGPTTFQYINKVHKKENQKDKCFRGVYFNFYADTLSKPFFIFIPLDFKIASEYAKHTIAKIENKIKENPSLCDAYAPPKIPKIKKKKG